MQQVVVQKGRTVVVEVSLGFDVSLDVITSEIRVSANPISALIATWAVSFATDGTDGELLLTLDDDITTGILNSVGYMDLKRVSAGEPLSIFDQALEVVFTESVTV